VAAPLEHRADQLALDHEVERLEVGEALQVRRGAVEVAGGALVLGQRAQDLRRYVA
jgi:hypothetical protein